MIIQLKSKKNVRVPFDEKEFNEAHSDLYGFKFSNGLCTLNELQDVCESIRDQYGI